MEPPVESNDSDDCGIDEAEFREAMARVCIPADACCDDAAPVPTYVIFEGDGEID